MRTLRTKIRVKLETNMLSLLLVEVKLEDEA